MDTGIDAQCLKRLQSCDERQDTHYWQHHNSKPLNFATNLEENDLQAVKKPKTPRDPMSHRIIEKRRRDRMNNCLADLSRLIPSNFMKQGQGRIEKTEIIEMAIKHIRQLKTKLETKDGIVNTSQSVSTSNLLQKTCCSEKFYMGFKECQAELMRFLVENEGWNAKDRICNRLMKKLDEASQKYTGNFGNAEFNGEVKLDSDSPPLNGFGPNECLERYNSPAPSSIYEGEYVDLATFKNNNCCTFTLNQDKHLRTLLGKDCSPACTENESGIAMEEPSTPDLSSENIMTEKKFPDSPTMTSDTAQLEDFSSSGSPSKRMDDNSTYKFKQNITLRFSEEKRKASDTSSVSSREENTVKHRRKVTKTKSRSPRSDSSTYPASDYSSNGNGSTSENLSSEMCSDHKHIKKEYRLKEAHLPGFLLHPMGSFYIPISLSENQVSRLGFLPLEEPSVPHPTTLLHPISIPVNFGSHFVTMRNIKIDNNFGESFLSGEEPMNCSKG